MITIVEEDENGDLFITLPPEILEKLGWVEKDDIIWTHNNDGTYTLTKKDD